MVRRAAGILGLVGAAASAAPADLPAVKARGALRVVMVAANSPLPGASPFFAVTGGRASGFDADVLAGFARAHGLKLNVVQAPAWDALVPLLLEDKGDVLAGNVTATEGRRKVIDFTTEVLPTRIVLVTRRPRPPITSREQLLGERLAATRGTSPHEALVAAGVPKNRLDDSLGPQQLLEFLRLGRTGAVAFDLQAAVEAVRRDPELELGMFLGPAESLAYGVRKDSPALLAALNRHIESLKPTPAWYRLVVQHFGPSAPDVLKRARTED